MSASTQRVYGAGYCYRCNSYVVYRIGPLGAMCIRCRNVQQMKTLGEASKEAMDANEHMLPPTPR